MSGRRVTRQSTRPKAQPIEVVSCSSTPEQVPKPKPKNKSATKTKSKRGETVKKQIVKTPNKNISKLGRQAKSSGGKVISDNKLQEPTELDLAFAAWKKTEEECKKVKLEDINELKKEFNKTINQAKRDVQERERESEAKKPNKCTRSGLKRGAPKKVLEYTTGRYINKGMDEAQDDFDQDELEFLENQIHKINKVENLGQEHIRYLIKHKLLPELTAIKKGDLESSFHDRYTKLLGKSKNELMSEIRMSLFKNEQRDYLSGYLQGIFEANKKDENGDIKHNEISYVNVVMMYEAAVRIVKFVHKFKSLEETLAFMKKKSREMYGISDDEDEDED